MPRPALTATHTATRASAVLRSIIGALGALGVDVEVLLQRVNLNPRGLHELPPRVPVELHNQVWMAAESLSGDPLIGLRVAAVLQHETFDVVGEIARHSATLGDAIIRMGRFGGLLGAGYDVRLEVDGELAAIKLPQRDGALLHLQSTVCQLATFGLIGCRLTGRALPATSIQVAHARPDAAAAMEQIFRAPMIFDAPHHALVFPSQHLHTSIPTYDAARCAALEQAAQDDLRALPSHSSVSHAVEALLTLEFGDYTLPQLAEKLQISTRTLARRLAEEETTYQQVRDRVRRKLAERYLRSTTLSAGDIALSLGFSDSTAFTRAFRRWTGISPSRYRLQTKVVT